ncbi:hypothetical protein [Microbacterium halotolerans]|uniref:hypothetical protein n=1 Tax=Microbacterium halotolerans TaxID=246613 RepID=UPI0013C35719|nr:hypothetical protein [Microbacterium halotolerans]
MPFPEFSLRPRALGAFVASVALAGALAACTAVGGADSDSDLPPSDGLAAMAETPVSSADEDPEDPTTWVISAGAVGGVRIGDDFATTLETLPDTWRSVDECTVSWHGEAGFDVTFAAAASGIVEIEVSGEIGAPSEAPRTPEGLGLGSTRDEVRAVYPAAEETAAPTAGAIELHPEGRTAPGATLSFTIGDSGRVVGIVLAGDAEGSGACAP